MSYSQTRFDGTFLNKSSFVVALGNKQHLMINENTLFFGLHTVLVQAKRFDMNTYEKDIALIILSGRVPPFVQPVQLAKATFPPLTSCQISAWNNNQIEYFLGQLVSVNVTLAERQLCQVSQQALLPGMMCAQNANERQLEPCTADGGGPLVCQGQLVGISSWGIRCGVPGRFGVYTSVQFYKSWIDETIKRSDMHEQRRGKQVDFAEKAERGTDFETSDDLDIEYELSQGGMLSASGNNFEAFRMHVSVLVMLSLCRL